MPQRVNIRPLSFALALAPLAWLAGCGSALPPCVSAETVAKGGLSAKGLPVTPDSRELLIGIDGSGSMLGHARAGDPSTWISLLQAINLSTRTQGLSANVYRVGGGKTQTLAGDSVTQATDPCFFEGCEAYPSVASSLQTLWDVPTPGGTTPLRLLVSDLEVNQNDISSLIGGIRKDLAKGASAGVLALKLPFQGKVFNAQGKSFYNGRLNRPVYLLATGKADQVRALLEEIRKNMALKGVSTQQLSIIEAQTTAKPLVIRSATPIPANQGSSGVPLRIGGSNYTPSNNNDYRFVRLNGDATGIAIATIKPWSGGSSRPDLGLVRLERIPLVPNETTSPGGIRLKGMSVAGSQLRLELDIPPSTPAGAIRATIPRGSLPEQWWIDWDRGDPGAANAKEKTDGLLLLLTTLGQQVQARSPTQAPAAALCVAFQHT